MSNKKYTLRIVFELIILTIVIMFIFSILPYGEQLEMKDYFQFAGSLFGAVIGAKVSFEILNITIKNQREEFEIQREKDEYRWKTTINQFNTQVKIQGYNDKINDYRIFISSLRSVNKDIKILRLELRKYSKNLYNFDKEVKMCLTKNENNNEVINNLEYIKTIIKYIEGSGFKLDKIYNLAENLIYSNSEMKNSVQCFKEENIINLCDSTKSLIDDCFKYNSSISKYYGSFGEKIIYKTEYDKKSYIELIELIRNYREFCEEYYNELGKLNLKLAELELEVRKEISKLYDSKYKITDVR